MIEDIGVGLEFLEFPPDHTCDGSDVSPKIILKDLKAASVAPGTEHRYVFRMYGLDEDLDLFGGSTKYQLTAAMKEHILQYGVTEASYARGRQPQESGANRSGR